MKRRALVIGAETDGLAGVHNDVTTMTGLLASREFAVDARTEDDATQAGIRDGYERLIADTDAGDAAVVYFSGHGGLAQVAAPNGIALPNIQFIVPADYDRSTPGDFRGITDLELSVLLARLAERTRNVSVILDCCHAAYMSRDSDLRVRAWPHPTYLDIAEHIGMLRAQGLAVDLPHIEANPQAVRLVACAPWESAYEYTTSAKVRAGILTDSLRAAVEEAGQARISWSTLIQRIRTRVSTLTLGQRPEVEGPARRLMFDVREGRSGVALPVARTRSNGVMLPGAALLGVAPGDQFAITPAGTAVPTNETVVARATVTRADGVAVYATYELHDGHEDLPAVAEAHPVVTSAARRAVPVHGDGELAATMRAAIDAVPILRVAGLDEPVGSEPVLAEVTVGDTIALWDGGPEPLARVAADGAGVDHIAADLTRLGRAAGLRQMGPVPGEELTEPFTVEWGRVVGGVPEPLPPSGALLQVGESIYLRLRNDSARNLYFFVFDLGVAGAVTLVTNAGPSGVRLEPGQETIIGERRRGVVEGSSLTWPAGVPVGAPRAESMLVIVTAVPQDLSGLAHEGVGGTATRGCSPLWQAVTAATRQSTREWSVVDDASSRFAVTHLNWRLSPEPVGAAGTGRFLVDDRPHSAARSLRARGPVASPRLPSTVAVRLTDLVVHRNRALGDADVRVDALVLTGDGGGLPVYRAQTARFSRVGDGDRLPLDNLLVYHGPAVDYLDIAWWVSRDRRDSLALSDLLRDGLTNDDARQALTSLAVLATDAPQAALAVGAVSASAVIVNLAYRLLSGMLGDSIGLYRTSLLATEGFGVGRYPPEGVRTVQDFSFAYEVVATG